jgi:hypothetical protein
MPTALQLHPALPEFGDADYQDLDTYALDCTANMRARDDTIADTELVQIVRRDARLMTGDDHAISNVAVVPEGTEIHTPNGVVVAPAGCWISWTGSGGLPNAAYVATFRLLLSSGARLNRSVVITIPKFVG